MKWARVKTKLEKRLNTKKVQKEKSIQKSTLIEEKKSSVLKFKQNHVKVLQTLVFYL